MNLLMQYVCLLIPLATHLLHDVPDINKGRRVNHRRNVYFLAASTIVLSLAVQAWSVPHVSFFRVAAYSSSLHFAFFNFALNGLRRPQEPWYHLGGGFYDTVLRAMTPVPAAVFQGILLFAGFSLYHFPKWYGL